VALNAITQNHTYAISTYHHLRCEFEYRSGKAYSMQHYMTRFVSDTAILWFSPVSSTNKTEGHDITEILLKMVLNTISQINLSISIVISQIH